MRARRAPRRLVPRVAVGALLLPVAVGAGAPADPAAQPPSTGTVLTRALSVGMAETADPVASVTVLPAGTGRQTRPAAVARRGVPDPALRAYVAAEATMRVADPSCHLRWSLLAGIGQVESRHGRGGVESLGPMQFVPATWQVVGVDGDGDDQRNPRDIDDAALAAAAYLCAGPGDLSTARGAREAVLTYNHSPRYAAVVVGLSDAYRRQVHELPVVATAVLSTGSVGLGLGDPGDGVLVGGSDNVANAGARTSAAARRDRAARPAAHEDAQGPEDSGDRPGAQRNRPVATSSPRPSPSPTSRPTPTSRPKPDAEPRPEPTRKPRSQPSPPLHPNPSPPPNPNPSAPSNPNPVPSPAARQYTGRLTSTATGFALVDLTQTLALTGHVPFETFLEQQVTVTGTLHDGVLEVTAIVLAAG